LCIAAKIQAKSGRAAAKGNRMKLPSVIANSPLLRSPWVKYGAIALGLALWGYGLVDQLHSSTETITYLAISLVIVAIAVA
jgi:hypothetical protein